MDRQRLRFGTLIAIQAAHSFEEYVGRLWESFPPAAFVSGVVARDRETGFIVFNAVLVAFGLWCFFWPVRRKWASAPTFLWFWITISLINGVGHPAWSLSQRSYTPGVLTAPLLGIVAIYLAAEVVRRGSSPARA